MFSIANLTRQPLPRLPFADLAATVLGPTYNLSLVFIGDTRARRLNRVYRQKETPANVLSFSLAKTHDQIFINLARARREHEKFGLPPAAHVGYLFIHGALHLKGYAHGSTMEKKERAIMRRFRLHEQKHRRRS